MDKIKKLKSAKLLVMFLCYWYIACVMINTQLSYSVGLHVIYWPVKMVVLSCMP